MNNVRKTNICKTQLTTGINFVSSKETNEKRVIHSKKDNIEIMIGKETNDAIKEYFSHFFLDIK